MVPGFISCNLDVGAGFPFPLSANLPFKPEISGGVIKALFH